MAPDNTDFGATFVNPFAFGGAQAEPQTPSEEETETAAVSPAPAGAAFGLLFQAPDPEQRLPRRERPAKKAEAEQPQDDERDEAIVNTADDVEDSAEEPDANDAEGTDEDDDNERTPRRRRRGGRGRRSTRNSGDGDDSSNDSNADDSASDDESDDDVSDNDSDSDDDSSNESSSRRRTRRRRRTGSNPANDDNDPNTVTKVREPRRAKDEVTSIKGSTRLEAKKQRRREGREMGRRRTVITEAEFLARRESVERQMIVRERDGRTQIAVLEDGVLAEHYVSRQEQAASMAGNVYLGRVQNVLPSMEAAFVDIGRGRNAVLYAGEVNWDAAGLDNQPKRIEHALKAGESVLVQVTKDPIGHKGARLTSQVSLPGRFLVYVPGNSMTGISRKLPDTERARLKKILKEIVPADAGVIVRTAAEGASEEELRADVERLSKLWEKIQKKSETGNAPALLHGEPDLTVRVIRDVFNEDFAKMAVSGDRAWNEVHGYICDVAPDLVERLEKYDADEDVFAKHRVDEQLAKAMDRKVWLPSGGSLVIDRTEAMTVVDVNTGKFVGSGGNLEETVTKNNIEAAEEIVRQLRLRDIGGIIVIDFIDMVLESNRDLVVRRLLECLGRDRTKHQVAEVTSLGLVQMTRKRVGSGLVEVFSEQCDSCHGRGIIIHDHPVENRDINGNDTSRKNRRGRGNNGQNGESNNSGNNVPKQEIKVKDNGFAQIAAAAHAAAVNAGEKPKDVVSADVVDITETETGASVTVEVETLEVEAKPKKTGGPRKSGRIVPKAALAAAAENDATDVVEPAGDTTENAAPVADVAEPVAAKTPTKRRSRRASSSLGGPATAGTATVMTVSEASAKTEDKPLATEPVEVVAQAAPSSQSVVEAQPKVAAKRPRRRAGSSAGAPVTLQPVDLTGAATLKSPPLTAIAGEVSTSPSDAPVNDAPAKAPARKKRPRVSSPAGAPGAATSTQPTE